MADLLPTNSPSQDDAERNLHEAETTAGPPAAPSPILSAPPAMANHPRYRLLELLDAGGMGAVYKAEHRRMERQVALKVMSPNLMDRPEMVERFHREVKAAALLTHENIVTAYDADQAGDTHFLIMEFVDGINLAQKVKQEGPLPIAPACAYIRQAALGLQHAFERGMVHRDVKPHNLMLTANGQVKILDFGLARFVRETALVRTEIDQPLQKNIGSLKAMATALTATGAVMGTADFISPEQATNAREVDIRADIYSLGCTLYYLLTGHVPFPEGTVQDKLIAHCDRTPVPLWELRRGVPSVLTMVVERMMAKQPSQRYQTPAEVAEELTPFLPDPSRLRRSLLEIAVFAAFLSLASLYFWLQISSLTKPFSFSPGPKQRIQPVIGPAKGTVVPKKARPKRHLMPGEGVPQKYRASIDKGLAYLAGMQKSDGHWEADGGRCPTSITALTGMAMLMEGSTTADGKYADSLREAVDWLMEHCQPNGLLCDPKKTRESRAAICSATASV